MSEVIKLIMEIKIKKVKKNRKKVFILIIKNGNSKTEIALDTLKNIAEIIQNIAEILPDAIECIKKLQMNEVLRLPIKNK